MTNEEYNILRHLPFDEKIKMSKKRITEWYEHFNGKVFVAFSGGKDSTVLLHLVRSLYPEVKAVYCNAGLEYPEVKEFVSSHPNIEFITPPLNFRQATQICGWCFPSKEVAHCVQAAREGKKWAVRRFDGFDATGHETKYIKERFPRWKWLLDAPFIISDKCCIVMKEKPFIDYQKLTGYQPFIGLLADESHRRKMAILRTNCNGFDMTHPSSKPLAFWSTTDIVMYLFKFNVPYLNLYGSVIPCSSGLTFSGIKRTGCIFCPVASHNERPLNKFQMLKQSHPKLYDYCMSELELDKVLTWLKIPH